MERGTREQLEQVEGRATRGGGESDDDIFGFRQRAVSEDALRELRRQNESNMARAMATLRGDPAATTALPAVYGANRSGPGPPVRRPARRKQPGLVRPQTPSEVRDAAEREVSEREQREHLQRSSQRQPQHRPPKQQQQQQQQQQRKKNSVRPSGAMNGGSREDPDADEQVPMHDESHALFNMLDWQKECRARGIDGAEILKLQPRAMYDKEFRAAESALRRHNRILHAYISAAKPPVQDEQEGTGDTEMLDDAEGDTASIAPERSVISNFSAAPSQARARREQRLQDLLSEARSLRNKSLALVHQGGVDVVNQGTPLEEMNPAGRSMLQVFHSLLETGLGDEIGLQEHGGGVEARDGRGAALRNMLVNMEAQRLSSKKLRLGKNRPYDDARLLPSHTRLKRERDWQKQVKVYSSWDEASSDDAPPRKKKDAMHDKTMMLLRVSERWVVSGDEAEDNMDLEGKLLEIQRRNKRMARMAMRTHDRGPTRLVMYDSDESEEDLYAARRERQQAKGRRKRPVGQPYRQAQQVLMPPGYAPDATTEGDDDEGGAMSAGGFQEYLPQDRRRLREIAAMRKARLRGEKVTEKHDMTWVDDVLPSGTEDEDGQEVDTEFMKGPLARQVGIPMSKLKGEALEKAKGAGSMEQRLMKMRADASLSAFGGASIGQTQEKIYKEVHKIRKLISGEVRAIFAGISLARQKMAQAKETEDAEQRDFLTQEAQRLFIDAETRANELRERYRKNPDMNLDFMPEYLRNFLSAGVSAQTMFDRGRLEAVQARSEQLAFDERRREERAERRRKRQGVIEEEEEEEGEFSDSGMPILAVDEKLFLKEVQNEAKQLNVLLQRVADKVAISTEADDRDAMEAADNAIEAAKLLESAMQMHRALKRKLKSIKAKRLRPILPLHLKNLLTMTMPLQQMWHEGHTEPTICEAMQGLAQIDKKIKAAKNYLAKFERGETLSQDEEDQARTLLEQAIVESVAVRERARAGLLDVSIGGAGLSIKRFPKHIANLLVSEESVIVLWEKGLIDKQICLWLEKMVEINQILTESQKHEYKAMVLGETPKGLQELAEVDTLQHQADTMLQLLRREIDLAIVQGMQKSRLPPHLLNILKDRRSATQLFRLGKMDPVMALFEQHADRMLKSRRQSREMEKRASKLMDIENRKAAMEAAGELGEKALEEMLQLRAKVLIAGVLPSEAPPGSALADMIEELEDEIEDGDVPEDLMQRALEALGISQELIDRLKKVTRERKQAVINFAEIDWEKLIGRPGAYLPAPESTKESFGVDVSPIVAQNLDVLHYEDGTESISGFNAHLPVSIEWIETEIERPTDPNLSNLPVLDDVHPKFAGLEAVGPPEDVSGDEGPTDAGMTQTDVYMEHKERKQQKKYDSDDDDEPERQGKKKKMKNVARGSPARSYIPRSFACDLSAHGHTVARVCALILDDGLPVSVPGSLPASAPVNAGSSSPASKFPVFFLSRSPIHSRLLCLDERKP